jgi:3-methyladenine DNA glycosylase Mpg
MHPFFDRLAFKVADELPGKVLTFLGEDGITTARITEVEQRNHDHCKKFRERNICNPEVELEIAVEFFMNSHVLFLRTKQIEKLCTCVQITGIELHGRKIRGGGRVCRALGLNRPSYGSMLFDGTVINPIGLARDPVETELVLT